MITVSVVGYTVKTTLGILKMRDISSCLAIVLYASAAINTMMAKLAQRGSSLGDTQTVLIGGSQTIQFSTSESAADKRNNVAAKEHFGRYNIPITPMEAGRQQGRIAAFDTTTDNTTVTAVGGDHS
ncbi:hypothetical protein K0C01_08905 [Salinarchaeum sp. IM2453]|uniref:hypothetical protein n=1 Tax=Salinarchaeum sp. IM2453 TaxID=2862870 RepID=UPI001C82BE39|nr:hypothetical protein [Salinarchaeum sp. IM2453]QZA87914.1 hypothetical protein K0C01_08905 [Salinarchaeum sp. IM2453]